MQDEPVVLVNIDDDDYFNHHTTSQTKAMICLMLRYREMIPHLYHHPVIMPIGHQDHVHGSVTCRRIFATTQSTSSHH